MATYEESIENVENVSSLFDNKEETISSDIIDIEFNEIGTLYISLAENDFNKEKKTLFATNLWPASILLSNYLLKHSNLFIDRKRIIEFGAGAAIPSLTISFKDPTIVCITDYPSISVIHNIHENVNRNLSKEQQDIIHIIPHIWGEDVQPLLDVLIPTFTQVELESESVSNDREQRYDTVIVSECIWKPDCHTVLLESISKVISFNGMVIIAYSNHIPGLMNDYQNFFRLAESHHLFEKSKEVFESDHMWHDGKSNVYICMLQREI